MLYVCVVRRRTGRVARELSDSCYRRVVDESCQSCYQRLEKTDVYKSREELTEHRARAIENLQSCQARRNNSSLLVRKLTIGLVKYRDE